MTIELRNWRLVDAFTQRIACLGHSREEGKRILSNLMLTFLTHVSHHFSNNCAEVSPNYQKLDFFQRQF